QPCDSLPLAMASISAVCPYTHYSSDAGAGILGSIHINEWSISSPGGNGVSRSKTAGRLEMSKCTAEYWKDRADEARAIRDNMTSEGKRWIMAKIAADYDRLYHWTLNDLGPMHRQQAIDILVSSPFSGRRFEIRAGDQ